MNGIGAPGLTTIEMLALFCIFCPGGFFVSNVTPRLGPKRLFLTRSKRKTNKGRGEKKESQGKTIQEERKEKLHSLPNVLLVKHRSQIAPPITSGPAGALLQETRVVLESCQHLRLWVVLHISFPSVRDHPASDKVIIVGIELVLPPPPLLIGERIGEGLILQNSRPIRNRSSRHAGKATVHISRRAAVEVASFQVQSAQEAPESL